MGALSRQLMMGEEGRAKNKTGRKHHRFELKLRLQDVFLQCREGTDFTMQDKFSYVLTQLYLPNMLLHGIMLEHAETTAFHKQKGRKRAPLLISDLYPSPKVA